MKNLKISNDSNIDVFLDNIRAESVEAIHNHNYHEPTSTMGCNNSLFFQFTVTRFPSVFLHAHATVEISISIDDDPLSKPRDVRRNPFPAAVLMSDLAVQSKSLEGSIRRIQTPERAWGWWKRRLRYALASASTTRG